MKMKTIAFIFIFTKFRPICSPTFFRCFLSNSEADTELRTTSFIQSTEVACSVFVNHNRVYPYYYSPAVLIEPATSR